MSFAVIGAGNTGQAIAGYLASNGENIKLYTGDPSKVKVINEHGLKLKGAISSTIQIFTSTNIKEILTDTQYILITTPSYAHKNIFKTIKPYLKENQTIVILPGYWGALECISILGDIIHKKNITILESSAMPFVSQADNMGTVYINKIKQNVLLGAAEITKNKHGVDKLLEVFPQLKLAKNTLETSLNNSNVTVHVPVVLFNAGRINAGEEFEFYGDGVSKLIADFIENLDKERVRLAEVNQVKAESVLTLLNQFYSTDFNSLYEALPKLFPKALAPSTLDHRYVKEDIPYGLVPISQLSKICGLKSPYTDSLINSASLLLQTNFTHDELDFTHVIQANTIDKKEAVK